MRAFLATTLFAVAAAVLQLTPDNFDDHVGKDKTALVKFFAPVSCVVFAAAAVGSLEGSPRGDDFDARRSIFTPTAAVPGGKTPLSDSADAMFAGETSTMGAVSAGAEVRSRVIHSRTLRASAPPRSCSGAG